MNKDVEALKLEIKTGNILIKEYERLREKYAKKVEAEKTKKASKYDQLLEDYPTWEEAHEAWGMGYITTAEFKALEQIYEKKDTALANSGINGIIYDAFSMLVRDEKAAVRECEWELLPEEEKQRIILEKEERERKRENRKEQLNGQT